ncbi:hypothetical protein [Ilyomonas limi]|nr:hypothetical protein [Ilyomonas limi]
MKKILYSLQLRLPGLQRRLLIRCTFFPDKQILVKTWFNRALY